MAIEGLTIIGESINDSVPSTKKLYEENDIDGILALAVKQDKRGAAYIDVNVGGRSPAFMADLVKRVQGGTTKPISIDTPDIEIAEAGLAAYDPSMAGGKPPILNSISPLRLEMFDLYKTGPFMPILLVTERVEDGEAKQNRSAQETYQAAKDMLEVVRGLNNPLTNEGVIFDPGIAPIGSDSEGIFKRIIETMGSIHANPDFSGVHLSVGLSNFTVMLPPKRKEDGSAVKSALESAFLTLAMPLGLDMIIGSLARKYELLPSDHPAMLCLQDVLNMEGFDAIMRVKEFYS